MGGIKLELTIEESNAILTALGQQPYIEVVDLIQKIQQQGAAQLNTNNAEHPIENAEELTHTNVQQDGE